MREGKILRKWRSFSGCYNLEFEYKHLIFTPSDIYSVRFYIIFYRILASGVHANFPIRAIFQIINHLYLLLFFVNATSWLKKKMFLRQLCNTNGCIRLYLKIFPKKSTAINANFTWKQSPDRKSSYIWKSFIHYSTAIAIILNSHYPSYSKSIVAY